MDMRLNLVNCRNTTNQSSGKDFYETPKVVLTIIVISELSENLNCLALGSDDLWHLAEVESICRDEMRLSVKFLTTGRQVALEFCQVFPIPKILVCTEETPEVFRFSSQNATFPSTSCTSSTSQPIGQWETHTRVISLKYSKTFAVT